MPTVLLEKNVVLTRLAVLLMMMMMMMMMMTSTSMELPFLALLVPACLWYLPL
jgi:hypothetical protein